jgi:hypothetical protein
MSPREGGVSSGFAPPVNDDRFRQHSSFRAQSHASRLFNGQQWGARGPPPPASAGTDGVERLSRSWHRPILLSPVPDPRYQQHSVARRPMAPPEVVAAAAVLGVTTACHSEQELTAAWRGRLRGGGSSQHKGVWVQGGWRDGGKYRVARRLNEAYTLLSARRVNGGVAIDLLATRYLARPTRSTISQGGTVGGQPTMTGQRRWQVGGSLLPPPRIPPEPPRALKRAGTARTNDFRYHVWQYP